MHYYYVISVDQHKCYYTHPSYHDDQVGLRFSFDVLKMYLEKSFINLLIPIFFRAWLRVTDPSTRTYQQNIWSRATFLTRKWKWYPRHRNKNKFHHRIPCYKTTRSINNSVRIGLIIVNGGLFDIICKFIQFTAKNAYKSIIALYNIHTLWVDIK